MAEKVLGVIDSHRPGFFWPTVHEYLFVTSDRVIVARYEFGTVRRYAGLSPEDILNADRSNFAVTGSEVLEVQLEKGSWTNQEEEFPRLGIIAKKGHKHKKYECELFRIAYWPVSDFGLLSSDLRPERRLEPYENLLRPVFGDKLSRRARDDSGLSERSIKEALSGIGFILVFGGIISVLFFLGIAGFLQEIGIEYPWNFLWALILLPIVVVVIYLLKLS